MVRFGSILTVLDGGEMPLPVCERAVGLARAHSAALTFVDIIDSNEAAPTDAVVSARRAQLAEAVARAEGAGVDASEAVVRGQPAIEAIRMVLREGHDLVVIAAAGAGDTAARLLVDCPCPVWLVSDLPPERVEAVLPAAAGQEIERIVAMAQALAAHLGVTMTRVAAEHADIALAGTGPAVQVLSGAAGTTGAEGSVLAMKPADFVSPVTLEAAPQDTRARRSNGGAEKG